MERFKRISAATALLVLSLGITVTVPVYAEGGSGSSGSDSSNTSTTETEHGTQTSGSETETHQAGRAATLASDRQQVREDKQQLVSDRKQKTAEQKQKLCVAHKKGLDTAAQTAQTASADSITNLKSVKPSIDCNNTSVASDVANFKTAAKDTRDKLKSYRDSVRALLHALATAKHDAKTSDTTQTTEGSN
jgi:hypothetical protein